VMREPHFSPRMFASLRSILTRRLGARQTPSVAYRIADEYEDMSPHYEFHPRELRNFVRVSSEFYPEIGAYYDRRVAAWFAENHPPRGQEEDD